MLEKVHMSDNAGQLLCIVCNDYRQRMYNTGDYWAAGLNRMTVDLTTGGIPGLLALSGIPLKRHGAMGLGFYFEAQKYRGQATSEEATVKTKVKL